MTDLYNKYEYISKFKFGPVEGNKLNEDSPLAKAMNQLTEQTSSQTFSGGRNQKLKDIDEFREIAEELDVQMLRVGPYGERRTIRSTGVYEARWEEEEDFDPERVYQDLATELRRLE